MKIYLPHIDYLEHYLIGFRVLRPKDSMDVMAQEKAIDEKEMKETKLALIVKTSGIAFTFIHSQSS